MRLALFQPDIPQNAGAVLRLAACFGAPLDIIEPCGFPLGHRGLRRAGMDYIAQANLARHASWTAFLDAPPSGRLVLFTTAGATPLPAFSFRSDDTLLFGRESGGVPAAVHARADARVVIPLRPGLRSLNVALAAAIGLSEALRQTGQYPTVRAANTETLP